MFQEKESSWVDKKAEKGDLGTAVTMLRALRGWSQSELAAAAGLGASAVSRYESGAQEPSQRTFDRIVAAVGVRPLLVRSLLTWIRKARAEVLGGYFPDSLDDVIESSAQELAEALSALLRQSMADLALLRDPIREPADLDPRMGEELWSRLEPLSVEERQAVVEAVEEFQCWPLCIFLCDKSLEAAGAGNGAEALELAGLAVRAADAVESRQEEGFWSLRLKGYALAHLAAAQDAAGDRSAAEETILRARTVWDAGAPDEPLDLDVRRLVEIEALVCANRNQS